MTPEERVREFLRQWAMMRDKSDDIYGVYADVHAEMATLTATDLRSLLDELERTRRLLHSLTQEIP